METWKKVLLRAAGFGAGFAIVAALIGGALLWWSNRPPEVKPWNDKAITASYDGVDTEGDKNTLRFSYTLENKTTNDYRVESDSNTHLAAFLKRSQSLSFIDPQDKDNLHIDFPIYIPAKSRVRFEVHLGYPYSLKPNNEAPDDEKHDYETKLAQYVDKELGNIGGFELLDERNRYKIVMPDGWTERAAMPLKVPERSGAKPPNPPTP